MMYRCKDCGLIFDESDIAVYDNDIGSCFGFPVEEKFEVCPNCGSWELSEDIDEYDIMRDYEPDDEM